MSANIPSALSHREGSLPSALPVRLDRWPSILASLEVETEATRFLRLNSDVIRKAVAEMDEELSGIGGVE